MNKLIMGLQQLARAMLTTGLWWQLLSLAKARGGTFQGLQHANSWA